MSGATLRVLVMYTMYFVIRPEENGWHDVVARADEIYKRGRSNQFLFSLKFIAAVSVYGQKKTTAVQTDPYQLYV